jgi:hypothetical protein
MIFNYVSLDSIIERITKRPLPGQSFNIEEVKEWAYEALLKIGVNENLAALTKNIEIKSGRGELPSNIEELQNVLEGESKFPMENIPLNMNFYTLTYKLNAGWIFTSFDEGYITINYYGLVVDDNNKPLIPDNIYFISAIEAFLRYRLGEKLYWKRAIVKGELDMLEREWLYYCPAAKSAAKIPREDDLHSFKRTHLQFFTKINRRNFNNNPTRFIDRNNLN